MRCFLEAWGGGGVLIWILTGVGKFSIFTLHMLPLAFHFEGTVLLPQGEHCSSISGALLSLLLCTISGFFSFIFKRWIENTLSKHWITNKHYSLNIAGMCLHAGGAAGG